jgi:hypothetical protein
VRGTAVISADGHGSQNVPGHPPEINGQSTGVLSGYSQLLRGTILQAGQGDGWLTVDATMQPRATRRNGVPVTCRRHRRVRGANSALGV